MTSAVKLLFNSYQLLDEIEKKKLYKLIKEEQMDERMIRISYGEAVEHMSELEEAILRMVKDLMKNPVYLKK